MADQQSTKEEHHMTQIDEAQLRVLDILIEEGGYFTADYGQVLVSLAQRAFDDDEIRVGHTKYQRISMAVIRLEAIGFLTVERAHRDEAQKANIIVAIRLL